MTRPEAEQEALEKRRSQYLNVMAIPQGPVIKHMPTQRELDSISVTRDDLLDICGHDWTASISTSLGLFLCSGTVWFLFAEYFSTRGLEWSNGTVFFCSSAVFGTLCLINGFSLKNRKRSRVQKILEQAKRI